MRKLRMIGLVWTLAWVAWTSHCQERTFLLQGVSVQLEDATERVAVFFRSMRLNRALDAWNVEVTLSNRSTQVLYRTIGSACGWFQWHHRPSASRRNYR
jgi:hypothetical protein